MELNLRQISKGRDSSLAQIVSSDPTVVKVLSSPSVGGCQRGQASTECDSGVGSGDRSLNTP